MVQLEIGSASIEDCTLFSKLKFTSAPHSARYNKLIGGLVRSFEPIYVVTNNKRLFHYTV